MSNLYNIYENKDLFSDDLSRSFFVLRCHYLKEYRMSSKVNSFFLIKWARELAKVKEQKRQKKITERCEKEWDKKLRGLK